MKKKIIVLLACAAIILPTHCFAQSKWKVEMRAGRSFYIVNDILRHWEGVWDFGAGAAWQATPSLEVTALAAYHHYAFDSGSVNLAWPMVEGYNYKIEGQDSYIIETSVGGRLRDPDDKRGPFLTLRGGIFYIREGGIKSIIWYDDYSDNTVQTEHESTIIMKPFISAGLGFKIPVTRRMKIILESGYTTTYDAKQMLVPLQATVQWDL